MRTNWAVILLVLFNFIMMGCAIDAYKASLVPKSKRAALMSVRGSFIEIETSGNWLSGEIIALQSDTLFILGRTQFRGIPFEDINRFDITLVRPKTGTYLLWGSLTVLPPLIGIVTHDDYGAQFGTIAAFNAILSTIAVATESGRKSHVVSYPEDISDISVIAKYARFPFGIPVEMEFTTPKSIVSIK